MKEIDQIKEALILMLNWQIRNAKHPFDVEELEGIKKGIEPTQPEGYQGLNKWYKTSGGHIIYAVSINEFNCYGHRVKNEINKKDHWCNDFALQLNIIERPATDPEIKEAILKGCEQHGIVEGARVKCLTGENVGNLIFLVTYFNEKENKLWVSHDGATAQKCLVFDNGKFAEVVKNFNCEDGNCIKQCDKCKDSFEAVKEEKPTELPSNEKLELMKRVNEAEIKANGHFNMLMEYLHLCEDLVGFAGPIEKVKEDLSKIKNTDKELLKESFKVFEKIIVEINNTNTITAKTFSDVAQAFYKLNKHLNHE